MNGPERWMEQLKNGLSKLPKETADDVIQYYSEYIDDAQKAGLSEDTILSKLGSAEHVVSAVVDEMVIAKAQSRPGPVNLIKSSKRMLGRGVARAAKSTSLALLSILPLLCAAIFYISSAAFGLAAPASAAFLVNSILTHPGLLITDIWAQVGLILTLSALCLAIAWGFWAAANGLTRVTLKIFRKIATRGKTISAMEVKQIPKRRRRGELVSGIILIVLLATGLNLSFMTDLVPRYWQLWNSEKPADIVKVQKEFPANIGKIKIDMLNTNAEIVRYTGSTIQITYEQVPYYGFSAEPDQGVLEIRETGNGKLPMIDLLAKHEGTTKMIVFVPQEAAGWELEIQTNGGNVDIDAPFQSYNVNANDGSITLHSADGSYKGTLHSNGGKVNIVKD